MEWGGREMTGGATWERKDSVADRAESRRRALIVFFVD